MNIRATLATGLAAGQCAADIGFGGGVGLRPLLDRVGPDGRVHGVELSETMLARGQGRFGPDIAAGRLVLHRGNLTALPLSDGSLDAAITVNTVYFVDDLEQAVGELARVVRTGGRLVAGVGDPSAMERMPFTAYGFTLRPVDKPAALLRRQGVDEPRDERVGEGEGAVHLLVADRLTHV